MKKASEVLKGMLNNAVSAMIDGDTREWPPTCTMFVYQPMRPQMLKIEESVDLSEAK